MYFILFYFFTKFLYLQRYDLHGSVLSSECYSTLYTVDTTEYVTAQIDATFHEGRENGER